MPNYNITDIDLKTYNTMRVSKMISRDKFNKAVEQGIYTLIESKDAKQASKQSKEYCYYMVEYLNPALNKSTFFVAVY